MRTREDDQGTTSEQVEAARAVFAARREAEELLAEASRVRSSAAVDADGLLREAQVMADRLTSEALAESERLVREAAERSARILADAEAEAEETRARVASEVGRVREGFRAEQAALLETVRERSGSLLRDLESGVLGLGATFERATGSIADVVATTGHPRAVTAAEPVDPEPELSILERFGTPAEAEPAEVEPVEWSADIVEGPAGRSTAAGSALGLLLPSTFPVPAQDENATSFLGTDPPRPVTDWVVDAPGSTTTAGPVVLAPVAPGARRAAHDTTRPLGWLFRTSDQ